MNLIWLALAWLLWCSLHSLLIHPPAEKYLADLLGRYRHAYRLIYNLVALVTLLPVGLVYLSSEISPLVTWPDWLLPFKLFCWLLVAALVWAGSRVYDMATFLGLTQLAKGESRAVGSGLSASAGLITRGILRHTRHPWYLAGLLLLWCRDLQTRDLVTNLVLSGYLLIGIFLEERKLLLRFGDEYRNYQEKVPMLWSFRRKDQP